MQDLLIHKKIPAIIAPKSRMPGRGWRG
jgi:hypothetical protein